MTKELEALENIKLCFKRIEEVSKDAREVLGMELIDKIDWDNIEEISIIEKGLKELQAIKEAKPSEALESLEDIYRNGVFISEVNFTEQHPTNISPETNKSISEQCNTIKQALQKSEKLEKAWEVVKEKDVDIFMLKRFKTLKTYNNYAKDNKTKELTQEEFELIKEMLE